MPYTLSDYGILITDDHAVVMRNGLVIQPDTSVWEVDDWVTAHHATVLGMLRARHAAKALPVIGVVPSREENDCAICALAMYCGKTYEDVLRAVAKVEPRAAGRVGLHVDEMRAVARLLGMPLVWVTQRERE
jgi:hypothetical protein